MAVLQRKELESSPLADLHAIASELGLEGFRSKRKADLIGAILDAQGEGDGDEAPPEAEEEPDPSSEPEPEPEEEEGATDEGADDADGENEERTGPRRRRRRRGRRGRGRRKPLEATFDQGEEDGYGIWLDPSVKDDPTYAEHWAGHRALRVTIEPDRIVLERVGDDADS